MTVLVRLLLVLACSLAVGACGGDDEGSSGSGGSGDRLTKAELVEKGDAICREANEREAEITTPEDVEGVAAYAQETAAIADDLIKEFTALRPPEELQRPFDEYVRLLNEGRALLSRLEEAAAANDEDAVQKLFSEGEALSGKNDAPARAVGFEVCGVSG